MATGIIAEYNPFHNGHRHQINCIKKLRDDGIVACMSGSITQRGEFALLNKWQRAKAAVANGVNLVIELPMVFACRSAQDFAGGGVSLLAGLGIVDTLAFGTEYPCLEKLQAAADFRPENYPDHLQAKLKQGLSYGAAISQLTAEKTGLAGEMLMEPNTILAIEYLRALKKAGGITPLPLLRTGAGHNDASVAGTFASGTAIRELVTKGRFRQLMQAVPDATLTEIENTTMYPSTKKQLPLIIWKLLTTDADAIAAIHGVGEGMEYKLKEAACTHACATSCSSLVQELATRRYPATRIQRILMHLLLGNTGETVAEMTAAAPMYARVLAFDDTGRRMLKNIRRKTNLPVITKITDYLNRRDMQHPDRLNPLQKMLYMDIAAANLRELCLAPLPCHPLGGQPVHLQADFTTSPVYVR
ncbi:tRNA(Met) cytidine acetate ligase [Anaerovibrio sp.]|uniref:tRNA(Met) cytidine acetate ligase n=1 Tax=Anaerovibrio sp. TaxID=1872532 RepID=UPI003F168036